MTAATHLAQLRGAAAPAQSTVVPLRRRPRRPRPAPLRDRTGPGHNSAASPLVLGVLIFIITEVMFFAGLISAFYILRAGAATWPPLGQPRLPVGITAFNTLLLFSSGYTMRRGVQAVRAGRRAELLRWLVSTFILGAAFLIAQGSEWVRLIRFGLTVKSSVYGALFYTIVGAHAAHVTWAIGALALVIARARQGRYGPDHCDGVVACSFYWYFVVALWGVIYATVYFA